MNSLLLVRSSSVKTVKCILQAEKFMPGRKKLAEELFSSLKPTVCRKKKFARQLFHAWHKFATLQEHIFWILSRQHQFTWFSHSQKKTIFIRKNTQPLKNYLQYTSIASLRVLYYYGSTFLEILHSYRSIILLLKIRKQCYFPFV